MKVNRSWQKLLDGNQVIGVKEGCQVPFVIEWEMVRFETDGFCYSILRSCVVDFGEGFDFLVAWHSIACRYGVIYR